MTPTPDEPAAPAALLDRLARIESLLTAAAVHRGRTGLVRAEEHLLPAWRRVTRGEATWPSAVAVAAAIALQTALPDQLTAGPHWLMPALEGVLLIAVAGANPRRIEGRRRWTRPASLVLTALLSAANAWSAVRLVLDIVHGSATRDAAALLLTGGGIWITNVVVFALWYWLWDRGGPASRAATPAARTDFLFVQMQSPEFTSPHWEPAFADYLYLSFTNATAFSPTDTMPLSRWAKLLMLLQSLVSLLTVVLVVARAVNVLG